MSFKKRIKVIAEAQAVIDQMQKTGLVTQAEVLRKLKGKKTLAGFTYVKSQNIFKKTNCSVDMNTLISDSYRNGYKITFVKGGKLFLNSHAYSKTTTRHVDSIRSLFRELGIKFDHEIELSLGNDNFTSYHQIRNLGSKLVKSLDKADLARTSETKSRYLKQADYYRSMLKIMQKYEHNAHDIKSALAYESTARADRKATLIATKEAKKLELQAKIDQTAEVVNMLNFRKNLAIKQVPLATGKRESITDSQAFGT